MNNFLNDPYLQGNHSICLFGKQKRQIETSAIKKKRACKNNSLPRNNFLNIYLNLK